MPYFHVWFATRSRKRLLQEGDIRDAVMEMLPTIADENAILLHEFQAVVDHVHLLLELDDKAELPRAMMMLKGVSSRRVFEQFPELKLDAHTTSLWQTGYGSKIISPRTLPTVREYIRTQWDRLEGYER